SRTAPFGFAQGGLRNDGRTLDERRVPRRRRARYRSEQARGTESRYRILYWLWITFEQPARHRITDSRIADVKESHIIPPKHAYIRLPQRRPSTLNLSTDARKVNDPKVLLF